MSSAPAAAWMEAGPVGYQMSSQTLTANISSRRRNSGPGVPAEIPLLIKHTVIWEPLFAAAGDDLAIADDRGGVVHGLGGLRIAHHHHHVLAGQCDLCQRLLTLAQEAHLKQEVIRRVPADSQLRKRDELGAIGTRPANELNDPGGVTRKISNDWVHLRKSYTHNLITT